MHSWRAVQAKKTAPGRGGGWALEIVVVVFVGLSLLLLFRPGVVLCVAVDGSVALSK
jgi:hypothetical protein